MHLLRVSTGAEEQNRNQYDQNHRDGDDGGATR